tara:strand:+ start:32 stop:241 length:210 start_codon:yes stop_codon:yes gene_type:complete
VTNNKKLRKQRKRKKRVKNKILAIRKHSREEAKEKREIWKIKREGEKQMNRLSGATYRKPKEISENTQD